MVSIWKIRSSSNSQLQVGIDKQIDGRRQWHPTPVLLPRKSHGRRSLVGCSPWGRWGPDMTEWPHFHFSLSCIGEGNGNPLRCSCLENPRDGGAWWTAVYGVAQSRTRLKRLSNRSGFYRARLTIQVINLEIYREWRSEVFSPMFQLFVVINYTGHLISICALRGKRSHRVPSMSCSRKGKALHRTGFSRAPLLGPMKACDPAMLIISSKKYFVAWFRPFLHNTEPVFCFLSAQS